MFTKNNFSWKLKSNRNYRKKTYFSEQGKLIGWLFLSNNNIDINSLTGKKY